MDKDTFLSRCANAWAALYRYPEGVDFELAAEVLYNAPHFSDLVNLMLERMQNKSRRSELATDIADLLEGFVLDEFGNEVMDEEASRKEEADELRHFGAPCPEGWNSWDEYLEDKSLGR
jgi:hypothetical protein